MARKEKDTVLEELRHEPVPGFAKPFIIIAVFAIAYLALILVSSPGKVKKDHADKSGTSSSHAQP